MKCFTLGILSALLVPLSARVEANHERWIYGSITVGEPSDATTWKGLAIRLGARGSVLYDLENCRTAGAWTGEFVIPTQTGKGLASAGPVAFTTRSQPGFARPDSPTQKASSTEESRHQRAEVKFRSFQMQKEEAVLRWEISGAEILEYPSYQQFQGFELFTRTLQLPPNFAPLFINVAALPADLDKLATGDTFAWHAGPKAITASWHAPGHACTWRRIGQELYLEIPPVIKTSQVSIELQTGRNPDAKESLPKGNGNLEPQVQVPISVQFESEGILLKVGTDLDTRTAADPENYRLEWSTTGVPRANDALTSLPIQSATVSTDERAVFLEIPGLQPLMQIFLTYQLQGADGIAFSGIISETIQSLRE